MTDQFIADVQSSDGTAAQNTLFCPACGTHIQPAQLFEFESGRGTSPWALCGDCATYFMLSDYDESLETEHTKSMAWGNAENGASLNRRKSIGFNAALDQIEALGYAESRILDVGCSFGGILVEARKRGFDCAGVDIVPEAIQWMKEQGFRAEVCSTLTKCSLYSKDDPADVISVMDAHIYWPDQPSELRAAAELLRNDGLLVMRALTKSAFVTAGRIVGPMSPSLSKKLIRRAIADHRFSMPLKVCCERLKIPALKSSRRRRAEHSMLLTCRWAFELRLRWDHSCGTDWAFPWLPRR